MRSAAGQYDRRGPITVPFTEMEDQEIVATMKAYDLPTLYKTLVLLQEHPRKQRMIQEAIERKRANGQGQ